MLATNTGMFDKNIPKNIWLIEDTTKSRKAPDQDRIIYIWQKIKIQNACKMYQSQPAEI